MDGLISFVSQDEMIKQLKEQREERLGCHQDEEKNNF